MNDNDQTILSGGGISSVPGAPQPEQKPKRNPLVVIGGIGCALLLCAGLLFGGGFYIVGDQINNLVSGLPEETLVVPDNTPIVEPTDAPTFTPQPEEDTSDLPSDSDLETEEPESVVPTDDDLEDVDATDTVPVSADPEIGAITFALDATEDYEPIDPNTTFEGDITEIHAIFEYSGFSADDVWERVWFLDGEEVLRGEEAWSGGEEGVFDYFINNAGGEPLLSGEWMLELYVEGELLSSGSFTVAGDEAPVTVADAGDTGTTEDTDAAASETATSTPTVTPTPEATSTPKPVSRTYKLAFTRWDGGKHVLYVGDTSGNSEQYIIGRAAGPSWTPDGNYLFAYGEEGIDRQNINGVDYVFDGVANGIIRINASPLPANIDQVRLYQGAGWNDGTARWANVSPNGDMVAFDARPGGDYRIYFLGTGENQQYRFELLGEQGDWSPDSQKVVYRSGRDGKTGIWVSNRDDSGHTLLTNGGSDAFPAWSSDGGTIVFHRDEGGNVDLYAMNADGSNVRRLTDAAGPDTLPVFTPSGEIIFRSARSGSWSIWKMNKDGSNQREIYSGADVGPDWSYSRMSVLP